MRPSVYSDQLSDIKRLKKTLRKQYRTKMNRLSLGQRIVEAHVLSEKFLAFFDSDYFATLAGSSVAIYMPFGVEINLFEVYAALEQTMDLYVPRMDQSKLIWGRCPNGYFSREWKRFNDRLKIASCNRSIHFSNLNDLNKADLDLIQIDPNDYMPPDGWSRHAFGMIEPPLSICGDSIFDWMIAPCVAVDCHGYRLGYGGGYYDRFLETKKIPVYVLAYDEQLQMIPLPIDTFDQPIEGIFVPQEGLLDI